MTRVDDLVHELRQKYRTNPDASLGDFLSTRAVLDTDTLADLIAADAEIRTSFGRGLDLQMYLDDVEGIAEIPEALDTAIEVVLRDLVAHGISPAEAVETLVVNYPHLATEIRTAAALGDLLGSTITGQGPTPAAKVRSLPCDFGPLNADGRPRYELRELLGTGTQGAVYLAVDRQLSEPDHPAWAAIKLSARAKPTEHERQRLIDEAARARRITHPNVVRVLDRGISEEGEDYLVLEHVQGRSLDAALRDAGGAMPPEKSADLIARLASGVHAVHAAGLVHCDLKPSNVLITESGEPKVADFGLAISHRAPPPSAGQGGLPSRLGTLGFMAPEQYRIEEGSLAPAADVYALGGLLVWLVTKHPANGASPEEAAETLLAPPGEHQRHIEQRTALIADPDLREIARRALAGSPAHRYASADALAGDLRSWLAREVIPWTRPTLQRRALLAWRRAPLVTALAALLVVGVAAAIAVAAGARSAVREAKWQAEAKLIRDRETASRKKIEEMQSLTRAAIDFVKGYKNNEVSDGAVLTLTALESILGPSFFATHDTEFDLWKQRLDVARQRRQSAAGGPEGIEALQWGFLEGFWLAQSQRYPEAIAALGPNLEGWRRLAAKDDPWIADLEALLAACRLLAAKPGAATSNPEAPNPAGSPAAPHPTPLSAEDTKRLREVVARCLARHAGPDAPPSRLADVVRRSESADGSN